MIEPTSRRRRALGDSGSAGSRGGCWVGSGARSSNSISGSNGSSGSKLGSGASWVSTSISSTLPASRSNRLGQRPHVRQALATGSLIVPHCEQRQGASATSGAYAAAATPPCGADLHQVDPRAVLRGELEDDQR